MQNYLVFILFFTLTFCSNKNLESAKIEKPNFIFYLADDQDQLDYGCYGNPNVNTSNIDQLANEGMKFTNFYTAQAICSPSRSQLFTGMYPVKNGCAANHLPVKPNISSITTYLKDIGYEVVLAGKSHVKPDSVFNWTYYYESKDHRNLPLKEIDAYLANAKKPFCLIIASDYPHAPYPKNTKYTEKDIYRHPYIKGAIKKSRTGYYKNIEDDNKQLGKIMQMVDKYKLRDNSVFFYASDHGISGKFGLSEEGLKVPFIVRWPEKVKASSTNNTLLTFVDVLPTILDISNSKTPESIDGKSFKAVLKGDTEEIHEYVYGVATKQNIQKCKVFPSRMIRGQKYKLIKNFNALEVVESNLGTHEAVNAYIKLGAESFPNIPYEELYDLKNDPYQIKNLASDPKYFVIKEKLSTELESWMASQSDFLINHKMPLLKPTFHALDEPSKWNVVPKNLKGVLRTEDYIKTHY